MPEDPGVEIATELRKAIAAAVLHNDHVASQTGMSHGDMQSLHLLQLHGPMTPGQLAELTGLTSGAMTAVVDRLERLGLATRKPHESDRRKVVVSPVNERIDARLGPYYVDQARLVARVIQTCKPAERQAVAGFLRRLNEMRDGEPG